MTKNQKACSIAESILNRQWLPNRIRSFSSGCFKPVRLFRQA